jgi:hypothetical protein
MENKLSIPEKLFLLSINPEKGGLVNGVGFSLDFCIIASFLMELHTIKQIDIVDDRVKINSFNSDIPVNGFILSKFEKFDRPLKISRWINRLHYSASHIKKELKAGLVQKRLIRLEDRRFLFFKWTKPYLLEKMKVREIIAATENLIYSEEIPADGKYFLSLLEPAGLLRRLFPDRLKRRSIRQKIKQLNVDSEISIALKRAIAARRAAAAT